MWETAQSVVSSELGKDERLLWTGQPRRGIVFRGSDAFMIPFSLFWGGFAFFWEAMALSAFFVADKRPPLGVAIVFPLFGLPFVAVGIYMIFGRFIVDSKRRGSTFYGLTNQRVIVVSGLMSRKVKSLNLRTLSDISLSEKQDRSGTITFGPGNPMAGWFCGTPWPGTPQLAPSFELIENARSVYELLREAQAKA